MELTWLGHSCFRLRGRDATVITDPPDPSLGYTHGRPSANIVTISHDHPGHNFSGVCTPPCTVIAGPGEYEVSGVFITGVPTYHDDQDGKARGKNVVYAIAIDEVTICHLGDLGHTLSAQVKEQIGNVDVLLVPVGGQSTVGAAKAAEIAADIEPKIVVPMHYRGALDHTAKLDPVERFLKEMGKTESAPQPRLSVTKSNLPAEMQVVVLEPVGARGGSR